MAGKVWTEIEEQKAKDLLFSGQTCFEVGQILGRPWRGICAQNSRKWHLNLKSLNMEDKLSRALRRVSGKLSDRPQCKKWNGKDNPNYGAKISKIGKDNPLSIWKRNNPGYQNGEKNPSFGRIASPEEIKNKTRKMIELAHFRKGKTYQEVYGEKRAEQISQAMSLGAVQRLSKQKTSFTKPELEMKKLLDSWGIKYEFQYPIGYYCVDFYIPSKKLIIQIDGCYWHGCSEHFNDLNRTQKKNTRIDHSCNSYLKNRGYDILRIWECKITQPEILNQIKSKIGGTCELLS
jgi:DNA mismatch endonuclease, patch repair protein